MRTIALNTLLFALTACMSLTAYSAEKVPLTDVNYSGSVSVDSKAPILAAAESFNRDALRNWMDALRAQLYPNWEQPSGVELPGVKICDVRITIRPDGKVLQIKVMPPCSDVPRLKESLEIAVLKSQPLPPPEDPSVFVKGINFRFPISGAK